MEQQNQQPVQDKIESRSPIKTNWKFITIVVVLGLVFGIWTFSKPLLFVGFIFLSVFVIFFFLINTFFKLSRIKSILAIIVLSVLLFFLLMRSLYAIREKFFPLVDDTPLLTQQQYNRNKSIDSLRQNGETESLSTDKMSDWQTYRNEEYGFEVMYPSNWRLNFESLNVQIASIERSQYLHGVGVPPKGNGWLIFVPTIPSDFSEGRKEINVGPNTIIVQNRQLLTVDGKVFGVIKGYWKNDPAIPQFEKTFVRIISTFKLIENDKEPDWGARYINKDLGFRIQYPSEWFAYDNTIPPCSGVIRGYVFIAKAQLTDCDFGDAIPAAFYVFVDDKTYNPLPQSTPFDAYNPFELSGEKGVINFKTDKSEGPRRKDTRIFVNHAGKGYMISFLNTDYGGTHDPIYDKILSTFRFVR